MSAKPVVYTIPEAAKLLRIGINQAYRAAADGQIPAYRIGGQWRVPTKALDRYLAGDWTPEQSRRLRAI